MERWEIENRQKLHELLDLCLDANGLSARTREETGTMPTVFFHFSGHVSALDISVHDNGWKPNDNHDKMFYIRTDREIPGDTVAGVRDYLRKVSKGKDAKTVLLSDIAKAEAELKEKKDEIESMKKALRSLRGGKDYADAEENDSCE